jgi:ubiquinol-cytochrome c reductase cytochrome b subunit
VIAALTLIHLITLHETGSSNPTGTATNLDKIKFNPAFTIKDLLPIPLVRGALLIIISIKPDLLGDVENLNFANPLSTPVHIQPE